MKKAIFIDAGHGGIDPGCPLGEGEKYYNLMVAQCLASMVKAKGYAVGLSRDNDRSLSLKQRCQMANAFYQAHGGIFVSIHHNAAVSHPAHGMEVFYAPHSTEGWGLAAPMHAAHRTYLYEWQHDYRGEKPANYYVLMHTKAPAILVECEFMTNKPMFRKICENEQLWAIHMARLIAWGIEMYYQTR